MSHPPGRGLAYPKGLGQSYRGQAFVRLQQQPHGLQPDTQRQLGRMQRGVGRHRKLEPAIATGALIKTRPRPPLACIAAGKRDRAFIPAGRTDSAFWPHHGFQQSPAMLFIPECLDHFIDCPNVGKRCEHRFRHFHLRQITLQESHGKAMITSLLLSLVDKGPTR